MTFLTVTDYRPHPQTLGPAGIQAIKVSVRATVEDVIKDRH